MEVTKEISMLSKEEALEVALSAGRILLCNGAETYRVEDTMLRICALRGMKSVSAFCTPSVILLSDESLRGSSRMYRITRRTMNLRVISDVNNFSFNLKNSHQSYEEIMEELHAIESHPRRPYFVDVFSAGLVGGAFAIVLGGGFKELIAAFICDVIAMTFIKSLAAFHPSSFWETTMAGAIICAVAAGYVDLVPEVSMELIIAGGIMPFVPGMAFTNGLRDYLAGDLMSGNSRTSEAIFLVGGLVIGVATVLSAVYH